MLNFVNEYVNATMRTGATEAPRQRCFFSCKSIKFFCAEPTRVYENLDPEIQNRILSNPNVLIIQLFLLF